MPQHALKIAVAMISERPFVVIETFEGVVRSAYHFVDVCRLVWSETGR